MTYQLLQGDCIEVLKTLPAGCVHTCVTSPPYFGLRDYGVAGQIGMESTVSEYVDKMVQVFRGVRRVLRDDGTVWLNLGDSYAGSWGNYGGQNRGNGSQRGITNGSQAHQKAYDGLEAWRPPTTNPGDGLKPKDLIGIPWRVAFALQQPYYSGKIKNELDRVWLASIIDGEGCMFIHKRKAGQHAGDGYFRKNDTYGAGLEVANTHLSILEKCKELTGAGTITYQDKESQYKNRNLRLYRWHVKTNEAKEIVREVYPYFVGKKHEARLLIGCPSSGEDAARAHAGLIALHNGQEADIDFPEPKSMMEPGYYLRSDVIWAKPNPMPESVTDRPTKSHEYLFLLAKSERYFYDAQAIAEPITQSSIERISQPTFASQTGGSKDYRNGINPNRSMRQTLENFAGNGSATRNKRSVWTVATRPYKEAHFATYPVELIQPCILAGTSSHGCCAACGAPWVRVVEVESRPNWNGNGQQKHDGTYYRPNIGGGVGNDRRERHELGWEPSCACGAPVVPCTVLDPFNGSGTTGVAAIGLGRHYTGIELNPTYIELAERRLNATQPALLGV